ncbi:MAG: hypothetical protein U5L02_16545 [Rheinheimera sp.]|jgi:hypothetical protein|nr:hypothetical protein [Rheinheimera sp.]
MTDKTTQAPGKASAVPEQAKPTAQPDAEVVVSTDNSKNGYLAAQRAARRNEVKQ